MHNLNFNKRILIAPLDWGLGHATRCIPLIEAFRKRGCEVVLAADGPVARLYAREFPDLDIRLLKGYGVRYGKSNLMLHLLFQLPRIFRIIRLEHQWLHNVLKKERFDCIISDNRPGLWSKKTHTIYITHQLMIKSGRGKRMNQFLQYLHSRYIKRFSEVWVPDLRGTKNLAGELSHPAKQWVHPLYMGLVSRLNYERQTSEVYDLTVLLSGPEPQRTLLENRIVSQLDAFQGKVLLVRGLPYEQTPLTLSARHITVEPFLNSSQVQTALLSSKQVVCRSGYTTLMDLVKLKRKAILIPTPGQPEQEYLARYMQEQNRFPYVRQHEFQLQAALQKAEAFEWTDSFSEEDFTIYEQRVDELLDYTLSA